MRILEELGTVDRFALLESFVHIVETGSLSAAAQQMGTTQPTMSRRLQALEHALGLHLVQRNAHRLKLTEDGERCYERAKDLLAGWDSFEADLRASHSQLRGHIRVLVPHAFGQQKLVEILAKFLHENPMITVDWVLRDHIEDFANEGMDCAIKIGEPLQGAYLCEKLVDVPRIIVASPSVLASSPIPIQTARDLTALPWLSLSLFYRNSLRLTHHETAESVQLSFTPRMTCDNVYACRAAAVEGLGVFLGSAWLLEDEIQSGQLVNVLPEWHAAPLPVHLVYATAPYYPMRLKRFVQFMRQHVPAALLSLSQTNE